MINLGSLTLFLSWKCNFACPHCGFSCGPDRKEIMPLEDAINYIDQACANPGLEMIAYSGGEPFLFLNEIKELMSYSYRKGLAGGIVTNCYWATGCTNTHQILQELREIGLKEIITSLDDYHLKYVPMENIRNFVKAAADLGIYTGLNILATAKSSLRLHNASQLLGINLDELVSADKLWVKESSPLLAGRAKSNIIGDERIFFGEKELLYRPCHYVIRNSVITPEGSFYACCGFGDASEQGPSSISYAGNLKEQGFRELFQGISGNLMFNIIHLYGPYLLIKLAQEIHPGLKVKGRYVSSCEVCEEIAHNTLLRTAVRCALNKLAEKTAV